MADEDVRRGYPGQNVTLSTVLNRLAEIEQKRKSLEQSVLNQGRYATKDEAKVLTESLKSLDKQRDSWLKFMLGLQKEEAAQKKNLETERLKALPYQMAAQQQTQEQNRKVFENLVRHAAGLEETAPLPSVAQKYYAQSFTDPQRAVSSVVRDLALAEMKAKWPETVYQVHDVMTRKLGRPLTAEENYALSRGDMETVIKGNRLLQTDSFNKLRGIPLGATVDTTPEQLMVHGYSPMKDQNGQTYWGRESKDKTGAVIQDRFIPDPESPTGFRQEKALAGHYLEGKTVPEQIWRGQDIQGQQVPGAGPGVFQTPQGQTLYRTYQGMGTGIRQQDVAVKGMAQIGLQDLLKPENIALANQYLKSAGASEITAAANMPAEAKAYMVLDALNKANLAAGRGLYQLSPEDMAKARTAFDSWSKGLATPTSAPTVPGAPQATTGGGAPVYTGKIPTPAEETMRQFGQWEKGLQEQVDRGELSAGSAFWMKQPGLRAMFTEHAPERAIVGEGLKAVGGAIKSAVEGVHGGVVGTLRGTVPGMSRIMGPHGEYTGPSMRELLQGPATASSPVPASPGQVPAPAAMPRDVLNSTELQNLDELRKRTMANPYRTSQFQSYEA